MKKLIIFRNVIVVIVLIVFILKHFFLDNISLNWFLSYYSYTLLTGLIIIIGLQVIIQYLKKK